MTWIWREHAFVIPAVLHIVCAAVDIFFFINIGRTSTLPAFIVFGKAAINVDDRVKFLSDSLSATRKSALVRAYV